MDKQLPLTYEQAHALAIAPLPPVRSVTVFGMPWAGVQVTDNFYGNDSVPLQRLMKNNEYDGIYRDSVNVSLADAVALFGDVD
jgi:hypothetical protein